MKKNLLIRGAWPPFVESKTGRIMRLIFLFLLLGLMQVAANSYSQVTRLNLELQNVTIREVLQSIESQSKYRFAYSSGFVDLDHKVDVSVKDKTINEILQSLFDGTKIRYEIQDRMVMLYANDENTAAQQTRTVSGKVTDSSGAPLPGVTVILKNTMQGTVTDVNGDFMLSNVPPNGVLVFSFVGMKTQEIPVDSKTVINVMIQEEAFGIEEVVAIGYGTVRKSDLTGSVSSVKAETLEKMPVTNLSHALQGRASGVQVRQTQPQPGGEISVRVRGVSTIMGDPDPLYIIDGVIGANINTVSLTDVESIEVLKDASSTAIYGSRGSNGVILITTKSGKTSRSSVEFSSYRGWQKVANKLDMLDAYEYAKWMNELQVNAGKSEWWDLDNLPETTDWQDEMYSVAPMENYNLSFSGGGENTTYFLSANYLNQEGVIENSGYKRYNIRLNLESRVSNRLKVGGNMSLSHARKNNFVNEGQDGKSIINLVLSIPPTNSPYDENGNLVNSFQRKTTSGYATDVNYLFNQAHITDFRVSADITGNIFADFEILEGLEFKPSINYQLTSRKSNYFCPSTVYRSPAYSNASVSTSDAYSIQADMLLSYVKSFNDTHHFNVLGGFTSSKYSSESVSASGGEFALDLYEYHLLSSGTLNRMGVSSGLSERSRLGYFGRVNYDYKKKYYLTLNGRYDGSSIFGVDSKWGFFPSGAVSWRLSEESFIKNTGLFEDLKLRASYGVTGSEGLNPYSSHARLSVSTVGIINGNKTTSYYPGSIAVPDLKWEETAMLDIGVDASFWGGRLNIVADYYKKKTKDLFLNLPIPMTSGVNSVTRNIGRTKNEGFEFGANAVISQKKFGWTTDINFSTEKMKVTDLAGIPSMVMGQINIVDVHIVQVGESIGSFYGYDTDGIWQTADLESLSVIPKQDGVPVQPGNVKIIDQNGDGDITSDDRTIIGNAFPKVYGGWNNTFTYKGFDATFALNFVYGNDVYNFNYFWNARMVGTVYNRLKTVLDYWSPENPSNSTPRLNYRFPYPSLNCKNFHLEDGSYLRLQEVTLGYSLPSKVLSKLKMNKFRFYVQATNLLTFTKYSGYDPDVNITGNSNSLYGIDWGSYPNVTTFLIGLNLGF